MSFGKCKFKQQRDAITHLLEWLKSKTPTTPNANEDVKQQELSLIASRNAKWYSHFGRQYCQFLTKLNIPLQYNPANHFPIYLPKGVENLCPHKKTSPQMFTAALFVTVKTRKHPRDVLQWGDG